MGQAETRRPFVPAETVLQEHALVSLEREVEEDAVAMPDLGQMALSSADPLQQILAVQLQQNQLLIQKLLPKHLGALSGGGSGSGSNVKGCLAREAFQRAIQDLPKVAVLTQNNAMKELGIGPDCLLDASLMRKYVERRMPLAEFRLLSLVATMLAESWAIGYEAQDKLLMGAVSRMMFFVEQTALDSGRAQLAWLLSGYPKPASHMMMTARKKPGLEPFARLCPASWISANLSYLHDFLDYMETRIANLSKPNRNKPPLSDDDNKEAKTKPKPQLKSKGKGKGANKAASDQAEAHPSS